MNERNSVNIEVTKSEPFNRKQWYDFKNSTLRNLDDPNP